MELPTEDAAKKLAREIAKQISIDVDDDDMKDIVVKTDDGEKDLQHAHQARIAQLQQTRVQPIPQRLPISPEPCESDVL